MPRKTPIIPGFNGSSQLLRSLQGQEEIKEKKFSRDNISSSSGVHSNSSDTCDTIDKKKYLRRKMVEYNQDNEDRNDVTSSSGPDDDVSDEDNFDDDLDEESDGESEDESSDQEEHDLRDRYEQDRAWAAKSTFGDTGDALIAQKFSRENGIKMYGRTVNSATVRATGSNQRRLSGPQSYMKIMRENDEEIEILQYDKNGVRLRHPNGNPQRRNNEYQQKRRSDTAIEYQTQRRNQLNELKGRTGQTDKRVPPVHIRRQRSASGAKDFRGKQGPHANQKEALVAALREKFQNQNGVAGTNNKQQPAPHTVNTKTVRNSVHYDSSDTDIEFPLQNLAIGNEDIDFQKARTLERKAKRRTKALKQNIADAKMDVKEAQLGEFAMKLRTRHAQIEERHAKLCRRRMMLKKTEDDLDTLEARLDEEEELHRARERKIRNRERRVKQEEAGLKLKEESLKKREEKVTETLKDLDKRRQLADEKEAMEKKMTDIIMQREAILQAKNYKEKQKATSRSGLGKMIIKRNKEKHVKPGHDHSNGKLSPSQQPVTTVNTLPRTPPKAAPRNNEKSEKKYFTLGKDSSPKKKQNKTSTSNANSSNSSSLKNGHASKMGWWI